VRVAVLSGPHDLGIEERPVPEPGPGEVLVRVTAVGVCGSDVHYWHRGAIGPFVVRGPLVLGHECAGEVVALGSGVSGPAVGDRVAMEPGIPCGTCRACREGRYNLCPDIRFWATPPFDGAFAEYVVHPADFCFRLPAGVGDEAGALIEPLSTGVHAARRGRIGPGSRVLVTGLGPIGLVNVMAAFAAGAGRVWGSDPVAFRRAAARDLGAEVLPAGSAPAEAAARLRDAAGGGVDVAVDCSGAPGAVELCCAAVRPGGAVVLIGLGGDRAELPIALLQTREVDLLPVFRYAHTYPAAIDWVASGHAPVERLITHRLPMSRVAEAFELVHSTAEGAIKVMIDPQA